VIVTDHDIFDLERIAERSSLVFDTRNATAGLEVGDDTNIVRL
jgi:UDP-N-acetyl-D-mannosaminuronate dehydrogenase